MANAIDMNNLITSKKAIKIIETSMKAIMNNPELSHSLPPVMLRGAPGVGKSTIVRQIANNLGIGFIDIRLAEMERVDLAGLPSVKDGTTTWNVPSIFPKDGFGILLLDEITAAPQDVQVAAYQLVLDRKISNSNYVLPDGWFIVAAGNRTVDRAVAKSMSSALANRFAHFELEANTEDWGEWAQSNDVHPSVTGYIKYRPASLFKMEGQNLEQGWPSPRSWERVSNLISQFGDDEDVLRSVVYGTVGNSVGVEFMEFHRLNKKMDDVLKWLTDPKAKIVIPNRADEKYAACSAISYLVWNGGDKKEDEKRVNGLYRVLMELPADFATMLVKSVMVGNKRVSRMDACMMIMHHPSYKKFADKYAAAMKSMNA